MHMNPTQNAVDITVGGSTFALVFDFDAIAEAEDLTGRTLLTGLTAKVAKAPSINVVRAMFFACAHSRQPSLTVDDVKPLVSRANIWEVWNKVLEAWTAGLAAPDTGADSSDPLTGRN